jgi:RNA polymerase sigma factor (sigma-70 family)
MVWGVCSRLLRSHQDAEDAFQATFLVLIRKAATLPDLDMVGNWLYGVARQTAVRMRALAARRGVRERQVAVMPEPTSAAPFVCNDLEPILDEELARLPEKYRVLIVLCQLEGKTLKDVARQLAIPQGTVASRLATARAMLGKRLSRRGVIVSGVLLGAVVSSPVASACVRVALVSSTIKTATLVAGGQGVERAASRTVAALVTGVTKAMFMSRIKSVLAVALVVGLALGGGVVGMRLLGVPAAVAQQPKGGVRAIARYRSATRNWPGRPPPIRMRNRIQSPGRTWTVSRAPGWS